MLPLADAQEAFAKALRDPTYPVPSPVRRPARTEQSRRFNVYRNNVVVSLTEALAAAFPAVRKLVGDAFFTSAARAYVEQEPPTSPIMLLYGQTFVAFLDSFAHARPVPYLGAVARLEWAWLNAFHARDAEPISIEVLADLPPDALGGVRIELHPSFTLIRSQWPVASLWNALVSGEQSNPVDMQQGEDVVIVQPAMDVDVCALPAGGYAFLDSLASGMVLADASEAAVQAASGVELVTHLQGMFNIGAVISVSRPTGEKDSIDV